MNDSEPSLKELKALVRELQEDLAAKRKRIVELEAFVGNVLRLSRFPWLHPSIAEDKEQAKVQKLLEHAWHLLPSEQQNKPTDFQDPMQ